MDLAALRRREKAENGRHLKSFSTTCPVKFRNLSNRTVTLWYDDGRGGNKQGVLPPGSDSTTNSYPGHKFCFNEVDVSSNGCDSSALGRAQVGPHEYTYVFDDGTASAAHVAAWEAEKAFDVAYLERTGKHWVAYWPKPPPILPMWQAQKVRRLDRC
jgi:hypothetical protein